MAGPQVALVLLTVTVAGGIALASAMVPAALVLPVVGGLLVLGAGTMALYAWTHPVPITDTVTYWDLSGMLAFFACGAALMSDPEPVLAFIEQAQARR